MRRLLTMLMMAAVGVSLTLPAVYAQREAPNEDAPPKYQPPGPRKSVEIGDFYFKRKRYAGALSRYKEAVRSDPHYAPAYLGLGKVYDRIGLKQKALENYQRYLDELPSKKQADEAKDVHRAIERLEMKLGRKGVKASSRR